MTSISYILTIETLVRNFLTSLLVNPILGLMVSHNPLPPPRHPPPPNDEPGPKCQLLGPLALVIQASMGALAISSLVIKRSYETPPRPWWIWFFDVSKQVFGALGLHLINLLLSITSSQSDEPDVNDNPCTWYFLNLLLDTTLGVPLLWFFLYIIHMTAFRVGITGIISGQYGSPPRWSAFAKQAGLYLLGMVCMKSVLYSIEQMFPWLDNIGEFLLSWTNKNAELQVVFVMLIFPVVMNTVQYYLIDTIIQSPEYHKYEDGRVIGTKCPGYDYLGQIEAEEENERRCKRHSGGGKCVNNSKMFVDADEMQNSINSWDQATTNCCEEHDENTPILTCTCPTFSSAQVTEHVVRGINTQSSPSSLSSNSTVVDR